ncbi:hypothetical protein DPMN_168481 [Dreissena polymorpha]|uniref:Integrase catalytic domain-containing protein n=1 Tax=Dreissena polymorpha TaxID=45954 RepID=A0A9D4F0R3_DREPO|nr:hypothetical protein DPMN_168481 [Dreissena polymorpha]
MVIPRILKSDNGAPFKSQNFKKFATKYGFKHHRVTPLHQQANGTAEEFRTTAVTSTTAAQSQPDAETAESPTAKTF